MQNEWFFKWHSIGTEHGVEIDSFNGKPICYGCIRFSGTAQRVYWDAIQRYLQKKVGSIFDELEGELSKYTLDIRSKALSEARQIVGQFAAKIRKVTTQKDRVLRGSGIEFPPERDLGHWHGCQLADIEARVSGLRRIYCDLQIDIGGVNMPFHPLTTDRLTLVKKDGTIPSQTFLPRFRQQGSRHSPQICLLRSETASVSMAAHGVPCRTQRRLKSRRWRLMVSHNGPCRLMATGFLGNNRGKTRRLAVSGAGKPLARWLSADATAAG
jgi:hypothetical protein